MMLKKKYKLIFVGTPDFSVPTLQALIADERFNVAAVITAPDAKFGRKQILTPPPVKVVAQKNHIPVWQPSKLHGRDVAVQRLYDEIKNLNPDAIIVIAYGQIIPPAILNIPKFGCLNLHASLLPKYRGASPIQAAVAVGDKITGVTLMKMDAGLDTGPIIAQEKIEIINCHSRESGNLTNDRRDPRLREDDKLDTGESLHNKLAKLSAKILIKYLPSYLSGQLQPKSQNEREATFAPKLTRQSGRIDWNKPAVEIERLVRAYTPWPGTWTKWDGKILKIIAVDSKILPINKHKVGEVFLVENQLAVQCGKDAITTKKLQLEGKQLMDSKNFLSGHKRIMGSILR